MVKYVLYLQSFRPKDSELISEKTMQLSQMFNQILSSSLWSCNRSLMVWPQDQTAHFNHTISAESDDWRFIFAGPASI